MRKTYVRNLTAGCAAFMAAALVFSAGFSKTAFADEADKTTLVYGSTDYTRINPAMDEHCEINVPGDKVRLETKIIKTKGPVGIGEAVASVDGKVVVRAELTFMIG